MLFEWAPKHRGTSTLLKLTHCDLEACDIQWSHVLLRSIYRSCYLVWLRLPHVTWLSVVFLSHIALPHLAHRSIAAELVQATAHVTVGSSAAGTAKQPHLSWEAALGESARTKQCSSYATHECGGRGELARGVWGSMRLPEFDQPLILITRIRVWWEAEITCWSDGWKRGGEKDEKHKQSSFFPLSFSVSVWLWRQSYFFSHEHSFSIREML